MTEVRRSPDCGHSPGNARAEQIALALMGVGTLDQAVLAEAASGTGRKARSPAGLRLRPPRPPRAADLIRVEQVVTHGRAGSVSGRVTRDGTTRLFCHVIRFTSASAKQVAQLVSFEHSAG